jgi:AcrR family transcriptional regulator
MSASKASSRHSHAAKPRMRRADKLQETRRRLVDAAAKVVGAEGYANASVAKITSLAEVAQGTFYNYFASQQDLFDHLLPELGGELLDFIRERVSGITDSIEREAVGFRAFFEFLAHRREFYRILNEAETFSPKAFHDHMKNMADGYLRALARSHEKGEMRGFERRELEVIVYTLLGARNYLSYRFLYRDGLTGPPSEWVTRAYMKLIIGGLVHGGTNDGKLRPRRTRVKKASDPSSAFRYRHVVEERGRVVVELDMEDESGDGSSVSNAVLLEIVDVAGSRAVAAFGLPAGLLNLNVDVHGATSAPRLVAIAETTLRSECAYVAIKINELSERGTTVATARAMYTAGASANTDHPDSSEAG